MAPPFEPPTSPLVKPEPATPPDNFDMGELMHVYETWENPWSSGWDLSKILSARDTHGFGWFLPSALFAEIALSNSTVAKALNQRTAPSLNMKREVKGAGAGVRMLGEAGEFFGPRATAVPVKVQATQFREMGMMGVAFAQNIVTPRPGGGRLDFHAKPWPTSCTRWDPYLKAYKAITTEGEVVIEHGNGKWIVFEPYGRKSFLMGAVYSIAVPFADIMYTIQARSSNAKAWGQPKVIAGLPENIELGSDEAKAFKRELQKMQSGQQSGMLKPFGADVDKMELLGAAAQIFRAIIADRKEDIADALTGQSGTGGPSGAAHGYAVVFEGVLYALVARDCGESDAAWTTGLLQPWYMVNSGKARDQAPYLESLVPDADEAARVADIAGRYKALEDRLVGLKAAGIEINQALVDRLCKQFRIEEGLTLKEATAIAGGGAPPSPAPAAAPPPQNGLEVPPGQEQDGGNGA